jgi:hypothetical protein
MIVMTKSSSKILIITLVTVMMVITSCTSHVEEADVTGTYVKKNEQPVKFRAGATEITLNGTNGEVTLQLKAGGEALLGDQKLSWNLNEGKIVLYLFDASTSGNFKGNKIDGLGGEDIVWRKK